MQEDMADVSHESMLGYYHIANKMFNSEDEGYIFYNKYGLEKGFSVRRSYVEWDGYIKENCV